LYENQLTEQAQAQFAQATAAKAAGKPREAHEAVQKAIALWPTLAGASDLARSLHQDYPVIGVGVISPLAGPPSQRIDDWAAIRTSHLLAPPIVEPSADGAGYRSRLGELTRGEDPRQLTLKLRDDIEWAVPPRKLTGQDVARCLLAAADPQHGQFDPQWAGLVVGVNVRGSEVLVDLLRPQLVPEAWLVRPIWWEGGPATCGPYQLESQAGDLARFVRQSGYFAAAGIQAAEIVERTYPDSTAAMRALARGEISLIDRLSPWEVASAAVGGVTVHRYATPTVHVLIPNPSKPLVAHRTMRRAILYGIDRQGILRRSLVGGQELAGCDLISGPLPRGAAGDRFAYGYDPKIEPRPYEPGTGLLLAQLAIGETLGAGKTVQPLVLAYPAEPVARAACQSIARQLKLLNLQITLKEQKPGEPAGDFDLRYAQVVVREPAVDAWRLLGPGGVAGSCSPAMLLALRGVDSAADKQDAAAKLQAVHRLAAAELPVIPLWQLAEHFAVHESVKGVAERPGSLYEGVEQWQAELRVPAE
jgi:peptide/nickel transport system substrate-binding protein